MASIITAQDVMGRMGLPDVDGVVETINSALVAAHARFQGLLDTKFDETPTTKTDLFFPESDYFPVVENKYIKLRLRRAFINPAGSVLVRVGREINSESTTLAPPDYFVDHEKGIVHVAEKYLDQYIAVSYLAGFTDTDNPAPEWLKEAILAYMPFVLNNQQSTNRSDEQTGISKKIADMSGDMVAPYMRGFAFQYRPMF